MAAGMIILPQYMPARDRSGRLVPGARLTIYVNRTTTKATVYSDADLTTPIANPVVANSSGQFPSIWAPAGTIDEPTLYSLAISGSAGESIGNPSVFNDWQPSLDAAVLDGEFSGKLDRTGDNIDPTFADAAKGVNIIVRNTPFGFGAVGNDPVRDTAAVNQMIADGLKSIYVPESVTLNALPVVDGVTYEFGQTADILRPAALPGNQWITASGKKRFRIYGGVFNGQSASTATAHTLISIQAGCGAFEIDGVKCLNPKAIGGAWGACIVIGDTTDIADGTNSLISRIDATCPADARGTFAVIINRSGAIRVRDVTAKNFANGPLNINDPTTPVPQNVLKQKLIDVIGVFDTDCGAGVTVFGSREGVDAYGDVLGHNVISGLMNISHCISVRPATYGFFVQGQGIDASNIKVVDGTCAPEDLYGGILFDSNGGTLSNFTVHNAPGVALELGGSRNSRAIGGSIRGDSVIGINTGASQYSRASHISIDGPQTGVLASGFDGADGANFFKERGRGLVLTDIDYYAYAATDRALVGSNGFQRIEIGNFRSHIRHAGAKGLTFDLSGADDIIWTGDGSCEIDETDANLGNHNSRVEVASATTITVPDHARIVSVTGTTTVDNVKLRSQTTIGTGVRAIIANAGSFGSGYIPGTTMTVTGTGTGALAIPVISEGKCYGGYVVAKGTGYTSASASASTGSGAAFSVAVGPASMVDHALLLKFPGVLTVRDYFTSGGDLFLGANYTSPSFGIGSLNLLGNFSNFVKVGL